MTELPTKRNGLAGKLAAIGLIAFISWIATLSVWFVVHDRSMRQDEASLEVGTEWGGTQVVGGPIMTIPIETTSIAANGEKVTTYRTVYLPPRTLAYANDLKTQERSRGIYTTPVYTATIQGNGVFNLEDIDRSALAGATVRWDKAVVSLSLSDTRGITSAVNIDLNGKTYAFLPSSQLPGFGESGIHTPFSLDQNKNEIPFSFDIPLHGSETLSFIPLGQNTEVSMTSDWKSPSFQGEFLPETHEITESGFTATWKVTSFGSNIPHYWIKNDVDSLEGEAQKYHTFGAALHQEVNFYTLVDRTTKYSILFVALTFLTFFMYEMLAGLRVHPMQYLLVGLAIALFYLLLLSFSELLGFLNAYLISTTAITLLVSGYSASILKAKRRALSIGALFIALYTYLYILLQLEELSLLFGSLLLFFVLAVVMYTTRNLNWYAPQEIKGGE